MACQGVDWFTVLWDRLLTFARKVMMGKKRQEKASLAPLGLGQGAVFLELLGLPLGIGMPSWESWESWGIIKGERGQNRAASGFPLGRLACCG